MKYTYIIPNDCEGNPRTDIIVRVEDEAIIPLDPSNSDYQAYLAAQSKEIASNEADSL